MWPISSNRRNIGGLLAAIAAVAGLLVSSGAATGQLTIDDHGNDRATATAISVGTPLAGSIDPGSDEDFFRLVLSDPTSVDIYTTGNLDTVGQLQDSDGNEISASDDIDFFASLLNFQINARLDAGTYYVKVRSYRDGVNALTGSYQLSVALWTEPGNTIATAGTLPLDGSVDEQIFPGTDVDTYQLTLPSATDVLIYTTGRTDTVGHLFAEDEDLLEANDDDVLESEGLNFLIRRSLAAGIYYVAVSAYQSTSRIGNGGPYTLHAETVVDAGGSRATATTIGIGEEIEEIAFDGDDIDFFEFELTAATDIRAYTTGVSNTVGALQRQDGTGIDSNDTWGFQRITNNFHIRADLAPGTYYIKVELSGSRGGSYTLHLDRTPENFDPSGSAVPLSFNRKVSADISGFDDFDLYEFALTQTSEVAFAIGSDFLPVLAYGVFDVNGNLVPGDGFAYRLDPGTYFYRVTSLIVVRPSTLVTFNTQYSFTLRRNTAYESFITDCSAIATAYDDDLYGCQWHLNNQGRDGATAGEDINVSGVWGSNMGEGIRVAVVDNGLDHSHEDLIDNVEASRNLDFGNRDDVHRDTANHGTGVAGIIAARDNDLGVRGVAPRATIYGFNLLLSATDVNKGIAMSTEREVTDVSNNSWGGSDRPGLKTQPLPWKLGVEAGLADGAGGKGTVYVFAGGNGRTRGDYSNLDETASFYGVVAACAVTDQGKQVNYSESGSNLWVCAPSNDSRRVGARGITTIDNFDRYRDSFGGTSASTPMVSGVAALIRKAKSGLTWRDVKLILAGSARKNDPRNSGWEAGAPKYRQDSERYAFNHAYGFGVVDAAAAVEMAAGWTNVPSLEKVEAKSGGLDLRIPDRTSRGTNTLGSTLTVPDGISFVEHIEVPIDFSHGSARDLRIELESPSGTISVLSTYLNSPGYSWSGRFHFGTSRHLGEDPTGDWTLRITDNRRGTVGQLNSWAIIARGHQRALGTPTINSVAATDTALSVEWTPSPLDHESEILTYDIRHIRTDADESVDGNWTEGSNIWSSGARRYLLTGLVNTIEYDVQIRAVNLNSDGPWSESQTGTPAPVPRSPTITVATPGDGSLTVTWQAPTVTGGSPVTTYDLRFIRADAEKRADDEWTVEASIWSSGALTHTVSSGLTNGIEYDFQIRAQNANGSGLWSLVRRESPRRAPGTPSITAASGFDQSIEVIWAELTDTGGSPITAYNLRYIRSDATDKADSRWTAVDNAGDIAAKIFRHDISNLTNDISYDVQLQAANAAGGGGWSFTLSRTPKNAPGSPTIDSLTGGAGNLTVQWTPGAGGPTVTRFDSRHKFSSDPDLTGSWSVRNGIWSSGSTEYAITGLTNGHEYDVAIRAVSGAVIGRWSDATSGTPRTTPGLPASISIKPGIKLLQLSWTVPLDNGGSAVSGYDLRYRDNEDPNPADAWVEVFNFWVGGDLKYEIAGLDNGTKYDVQIRALNIAGAGLWIEDQGVPIDPPSIAIEFKVAPAQSSLEVSWEYSDEDTAPVDYWEVRSRSLFSGRQDSDWVVEKDIAGYRSNHIVAPLAGGDSYEAQVRGVNSVGPGPWSETKTGTPYTYPSEPVLSPLLPGDGRLTVIWSVPANDGGAPITSYDLRLSKGIDPDVAGSWRELQAAWTAGDDAKLGLLLTGLENGESYWVGILAVNAAGRGDWSDSRIGTPRTIPGAPTIRQAKPGDGTLTISWRRPSFNGGAAVTSYDLRHKKSADPDQESSWTEDLGIWSNGDLEAIVAGLDNGTGYDLQVRAVNPAGFGAWSTSFSAMPQKPPGAPIISAIDPDPRQLKVFWERPTDVGGGEITHYDLRHKKSADPDQGSSWTEELRTWSSGDLEATVYGLENGTSYDIQIRAATAVNYGVWSLSRNGTPRTVPGAAVIVDVEAGVNLLTVSWQSPSQNGGASITSFDLRHKKSSDPNVEGSWTLIDRISAGGRFEYTVSGLENSIAYDVQIRAVNAGGDGAWSAPRTGTPRTVPGEPNISKIDPGPLKLKVFWDPPGANGGAEITGYDLRHKRSSAPDLNRNWTEIIAVWPIRERSYLISTGIDNGITYDVQVRAVNSAGAGAWSTSANGTPRTVPGSPTISQIEPGPRELSVYWNQPSDNGGAEITGYDLQRKRSLDPDVPGSWTLVSGFWSGGNLNFSISSGLSNGTAYDIQIRAVNAEGEGVWSTSSDATPRTVPGRPNVTEVVSYFQGLIISWQRPSATGGAVVTGYDLRRKRSSDPDEPGSWTEALDIWSGGNLEYSLSGLLIDTPYDVQVRAVNAAGGGSWSSPRSGVPNDNARKPVIRTISADDRELTVEWLSPTDDGGSPITNYDLRHKRSRDPDRPSSWTTVIGILSGGNRQYSLSGLANGTSYDLQVRADSQLDPGPWSSTRSGTPVVIPGIPTVSAVEVGNRTLIVSWQRPIDDGGAEIATYHLRHKRSLAPDVSGSWTQIQDVWSSGRLAYSLGGLANGTGYDVQISAVNIAGSGGWSESGDGTPISVPGAPAIQSVIGGIRTLMISWRSPTDPGGSAITAYGLRYKKNEDPDQASSWTEVRSIWTSGSLEYSLLRLADGISYNVELRARNSVGAGERSEPVTGTTIVQRPTAPNITSATAGDQFLTVVWRPPSSDGGARVESYDLRHKFASAPDVPGSWTLMSSIWAIGDRRLEVILPALDNDSDYELQIRAENSSGVGAWSPSQSGRPSLRRSVSRGGGGGGGGGRRIVPPDPILPEFAHAVEVAVSLSVQAPGNSDLLHNIPNLTVTLDNGLVVQANFLAHYEATGKLDRWGYPTSEVLVLETGTLTQFYQRGVVDFHNVGQGWLVERRLGWDYLGGGVGGSLDQGTEPGILNPNPGEPFGPWGHKVSDFSIEGAEVGFAAFFYDLGGVGAFGFPKTDARVDVRLDGRLHAEGTTYGFTRQYFQAAVFEYHPGDPLPVKLALLGDILRDQLVPDFADHDPFHAAEPLGTDAAYDVYLVPVPVND